MQKRNSTIVVVILLFSMAVVFTALGMFYGFCSRNAQVKYEKLAHFENCCFELDVTVPNKVRAEFCNVCDAENGYVIFIEAEGIVDYKTLAKAFVPSPAVMRFYDGEEMVGEEKLVLTCTKQSNADDSRMVPFALMTDLPNWSVNKTLTAELELTSPVKVEEIKSCFMHVKYACSPLHYLKIAIWEFLFFFSLIIACFFLLAALRFKRCLFVHSRNVGDKTLVLLASYPRLTETFVRLDLQHMKEQGIPLHVVALFGGDCKIEDGWPNVKVLHPEITVGGAKAISVKLPIPKYIRAVYSLYKHRKLLNELVRECQENSIMHIHAEFADLAALLAERLATLTKCTYSIGVHASDVHSPKYPDTMLFAGVSFVLACNQYAAMALKERCHWLDGRIHILYHGINLDAWPYLTHNSGKLDILFIGRLVPKKGVGILLRAIDIISNKMKNQISLTIVGSGYMESELRELANSLDVANLITWVSVSNQDGIRELFAQSTCLCMPSVVAEDGDRDGIPNVVLEAMASGLPVVGSQAGSLPEILTEETGWELTELTPETLAEAVVDMMAQPGETARRCQNARNMVEYRFNAQKIAEKRANFFRKY